MQLCSSNNSTSPKNIVIIGNISFLAILAHPVCYYNRSAVESSEKICWRIL